MLTITIYSNKVRRGLTWYLGTKNFPTLSQQEILDVIEIRADGSELQWITDNMKNLPYFKGDKSQRWFGDHAKFIAGCLTKD